MRTEPPNGDELARLLASMRQQVIQQTAHDPLPSARESRVRNGVLGALAAVALLLGLGTGAAFAFGLWPEASETGGPLATSTAAPSAAPSPTIAIEEEEYTAVPAPDPVPVAIEISSDRMVVVADDGSEFAAFSYFDDPEAVVAMLTELLGEPSATEVASRGDGFTGTRYEWEGLDLYDRAASGSAPRDPGFHVGIDAPISGGLTLRGAPGVGTASGVSVGDPVGEVVTEEPWTTSTEYQTGRATLWTRVGIGDPLPPSPLEPEYASTYERNFGVALHVYVDNGVIESFGAPSPNWGV